MKGINVHKSSGIPDVSSSVLKDALLFLVPQLKHVFATSLKNGQFPRQWAKGIITPIPKSGNSKSINNWRPISLLPIPGKLLEKVVHGFIYNFLETRNLLSANQFGFRKGVGTGDAILKFVNVLYESRDRGEITAACFIDYSKAFDSVHHGRLFEVIRELGLPSNILRWLYTYLYDRRQRTYCNNKLSVEKHVNFGVPQGSVLGPLLFILYINGLNDIVEKCCIQMYADDVIVYVSGKCPTEVLNILQNDLNRINDWCKTMYLTVNAKKSKVVWFGSPQKVSAAPSLQAWLGGTCLPTDSRYNYLGVIVDQNLTMEGFVKELTRKVGLRLYKFSKIRYLLSTRVSKVVYRHTIAPLFDYCGFLVDGLTVANRAKLQRLQNRALCICVGGSRTRRRVADLHTECSVDLLEVRRTKQLAVLMYKKSRQCTAIRAEAAELRTRSEYKRNIPLPRMRTELGKRSPLYRGLKIWNGLSKTMQDAPSKFIFKKLLSNMFLDRTP